jgi:phosphoglucomutase
MAIRFGTSGWRAIIADEFTFDNVRRVVKAVAAHITEQGNTPNAKIIVGFDTRFMGEQFAALSSEVLKSYGFQVLLCDSPTPTPVISHAIRHEKAVGGLNFTASHNPPQYQGIKFSTADGAPALPNVTQKIEELVKKADLSETVSNSGGTIENYNPRETYFADLRGKIRFDVIRQAGKSYVYDPLWGTGRGYLNEILQQEGLEVQTIHDWRDVTFGGRAPEPSEDNVAELRQLVLEKGCILGLATDGDGDRFGVLDADGSFITANQLIAILTDYMAESRGWTEGVARSVATSHLVDRVARDRGLKLYETPVGFKYIGEMIVNDQIILGGEESAGLSIKGHLPEKDGILACLLAAEAVAARGASLTEQLNNIYARVGRIESGRIGVRLTPEIAAALSQKLSQEPTMIGNRRVAEINRTDGVKFLFADGSWLLMRPSGTEPLVRVYAETENLPDLEVLLEQGRQYLLA